MGSKNCYIMQKRLERLDKLNSYIWRTVSPYIVGNDILEVGAGVGIYTEFLLRAKKNIVSIDIMPEIKTILERKFSHIYPSFEPMTLGISEDSIDTKIQKHYDTILCLNVLEHVEDDEKAILNISKLLKADGRIILLVPAFKFLYGTLDQSVGHYRRYVFSEIKQKLEKNGLIIEKHFYLHFLGIFGWFVHSRITKSTLLNNVALKTYNNLIFFCNIIDKIVVHRSGQSLMIIARHKGELYRK